MGLFFDRRQPQPVVQSAIQDALATQPDDININSEAAQRANIITEQLGEEKTFNRGRFIAACLIVVILVAAAIGTEATGLTESSRELWSLTTTIFGVITGFLGGEAVS